MTLVKYCPECKAKIKQISGDIYFCEKDQNRFAIFPEFPAVRKIIR